MKRLKIKDTINMLNSIHIQSKFGDIDSSNIQWLIDNSNIISTQIDTLLGIANVSSGYSVSEIEDCVLDIQNIDATLH